MTSLTILPNTDKKTLKLTGKVAAGEHVAVSVSGGADWIGEGKALRLRVLFGMKQVAMFPLVTEEDAAADTSGETVADAWAAGGEGAADATCTLNLFTIPAEKYLKFGGNCLWVLDDIENNTLYGMGEMEVLPWPKRRGSDVPYALDEYPDIVAELGERIDAAVDEVNGIVAYVTAAKSDAESSAQTARVARNQAQTAQGKAEDAQAAAEAAAEAALQLDAQDIGALPLVEDANNNKTAVTIGRRTGNVGANSLANGYSVVASGAHSHAEGESTTASGNNSHAEGFLTTASGDYSHAEGYYATASGDCSHAEGSLTTASGAYSHAEGYYAHTKEQDSYAFAWNGDETRTSPYESHGSGTFNINPKGGLDGFWIGEQTLSGIISDGVTNKADKVANATSGNLAALDPNGNLADSGKAIGDFAVAKSLAPAFVSYNAYEVGDLCTSFDNDENHRGTWLYKCILATDGSQWTPPEIDPTHWALATVEDVLAALRTAVANKVGSFASVGGATATVENGVAKLSDFFTESNSLLTATIDAEVISKGTAPDAHLEAPTDEHLKLILADNSVAYDSAKALPYKFTSVIGDRVIATMTLTAASTDIALPTVAANDTTVKDFILDVTNAYAVEGVATDAGINIPRTDFKLVTRDGESLTAVTTVKAGKSAFICFTQKSPVVVDGTTYPCWCVIQLPFGEPS